MTTQAELDSGFWDAHFSEPEQDALCELLAAHWDWALVVLHWVTPGPCFVDDRATHPLWCAMHRAMDAEIRLVARLVSWKHAALRLLQKPH